MLEKIKVSTTLLASPERIYKAWLNSKEHGLFTGSEALASSKVGKRFMAWDGYIKGKNLFLEPNKRIIQSWRSTDFPERSSDSKIEIIFEKVKTGTKVTLIHSEIPEGQSEGYKKGWKDFYFKPMKKFFSEK
jgi:activator of HSP90 ATPase